MTSRAVHFETIISETGKETGREGNTLHLICLRFNWKGSSFPFHVVEDLLFDGFDLPA